MILYGNLPEYDITENIFGAEPNKAISQLLAIADNYRLCGNLWHSFIAWLLINDENQFSVSCEMRDVEKGGLFEVAKNDFIKLYELFNSTNTKLNNDFDYILSGFDYSKPADSSNLTKIGEYANSLAQKLENAADYLKFMSITTDFYVNHGVGMFGLNRAFYLKDTENNALGFTPICDFDDVALEDLWGYEHQKQQLCDNTTAFLQGKPANNVLLYGDSGTGKSTSIKAILNTYYPNGLRMIEVYKHQFKVLPQLIEVLRRRNYKFVIFMDDLSFEDFEIEYKFLKAVIEGGLEKKPDNVLIYATSNRRHLIRESFKERSSDDDVHNNDTIQEKLSLSERFGLMINFTKPLEKEYFEIVKYLARLNNIDIDEQELILRARQWGLRHSGVSGRIAQQFISTLI